MRRKVIKQRDSYTVTLPIKWVKAHAINSEVDVHEEDARLTISPIEKMQQPKKTTNVSFKSEYGQYIKMVITNAYRIGYDALDIDFRTEKQFKLIKEIVSEQLIGYDITEKKGSSCIIESITEPPEDKVGVILRKIFFIIQDNSRSILDFFKNNGHIDLAYLESQTKKVDQYAYFCMRTISKKIFEEKAYFRWMLLTYLILIQHSYFRLIDYFSKKEKRPSKPYSGLFEKVDNYLSNFSKAFFNADIESFALIIQRGEELLYKDCYAIFENGKEGPAAYHLASIIRHIYLSSFPSAGIFMSYKN